MVMTHKTKQKFQPKWEGPFVVESVYSEHTALYPRWRYAHDADQWQIFEEVLYLTGFFS